MFYTCRVCHSYGYTDLDKCSGCNGEGKIYLTKEVFLSYVEGYRRIEEVASRLVRSFAALSGNFIPANVQLEITELNDEYIEFSGEDYYGGSSDYYRAEIPVAYLYDPDFRTKYFVQQVLKSREEELLKISADLQAKGERESRDRKLYLELKKKYEDIEK